MEVARGLRRQGLRGRELDEGIALLSLLPLGVIGTGVWYLRRRARQIAAAEAARNAAARAAW